MRARLPAPWAALAIVAALANPAPAQCVFGGAPGFTGCAPGGGIAPAISCNAPPAIGTTFSIAALNLWSVDSATLLVGSCSSGYPLPAGLPVCPSSPSLGGCALFVAPDFLALPSSIGTLPTFGITVPWSFPIPNDPAFVGLHLCVQLVGIWTGSPLCIQASNGLSITVLP